MGMKYLLWYAVPWMGEKSANLAKFRDKVLYHNRTLKAYCLDPRFPEVREFLVSLYVRALQEWDIDGFKLDFIDSFHFSHGDPAVKENYRGRDIRSLIEAVQRLMSDIYTRLSAIKPDVLIEFRQAYIGPSIRLAGNMLRVADCPADMHVNRSGIVNLRLTSGKTAVHADPLEWHPTDTPEAAAKNVLSALFATVQYSMKLASLDARHVEMIAHWSRFGAAHVDALQRGRFRAYHPELAYPLLEGESDVERIFGVYAAETAVSSGPLDKPVYVLNATDASSLIVELPSAATVESYDTYGAKRVRSTVAAGCRRLTVPPSGYLLIRAVAAK
jgi:alpha-galactosidase